MPFSRYEVHHVNENKLDNNPHNLEILLLEEHALRHRKAKSKEKEKIVFKHGQKYVRLAKADRKRKEKKKSIYISGKRGGWYPLKYLIVRDGYIYAPEKIIYRKIPL
ncbi:MAG: hypothetical protein ACFFAS_14565 [Promethearchaeota archaeon]